MTGSGRRSSLSSVASLATEEEYMEAESVGRMAVKRKNEVGAGRESTSSGQGDSSEERGRIKKRPAKEKKRSRCTEKEEDVEGSEELGRKKREEVERKREEEESRREDSEMSEDEVDECDEEEKGEKRKEEMETEDIARKVMGETRKILKAVANENNRKISMKRKKQSEVRGAVATIVMQVGEMLARQLEVDREMNKMKKEIEILRMDRESVRAKEKRNEREGKRGSRGVVEPSTEEGDESSGSYEEVKGRRRQRTYAEVSRNGERNVSKGEKDERTRIEGRVVVPGREGWKTPPPTTRDGENTLIISSKDGRGSRELTKVLAKNLPAKEIGGAPPVVRETRDGKVIVVPKNREQQLKITERVGKMKEVEIKEKRKAEPLLVISGVEVGMSEKDLIEQLARGMEGSVNGIKVLKRMPCRNPWR